jgi:hypothetical protein
VCMSRPCTAPEVQVRRHWPTSLRCVTGYSVRVVYKNKCSVHIISTTVAGLVVIQYLFLNNSHSTTVTVTCDDAPCTE